MPLMDEAAIKEQKPYRIGILPLPGFALLSYAATTEMLRAANLLSGSPRYEVITIASHGADMIHSSGAAHVTCTAHIGDTLPLDYLFVIAGGDPFSHDDPRLMAWLARMARRGVRMGGVSGGAVILARAGLMAGRRMTLHWEHASTFADIFPHLVIERSLYVIDRDRLTCAGGTAPIDLMHALIASHYGTDFARQVSDWFMHTDVRPSAGPQRAGLVERVGTTNAAILDAVDMMESHIADPVTLSDLANVASVSARQLNRLFQDHLGASTMGYYRNLRLNMARDLLRGSSFSLTEIALATGFANSAHFSRSYRTRYGAPPSSQR